MIVVGSANSSNSVRLVEVALEYGAKAAYRVDYADEVEQAWFDGVATVGVTSGASVPDVLVQQVLEDLAGRRLPRRRRGAHGRGGPAVLAPEGAATGCRGSARRPRARRADPLHERPDPDAPPRPQYGEYATPEEQRARIRQPDAAQPVHAGRVRAPVAVTRRRLAPRPPRLRRSTPRARHAVDRIVTFALLAYGLVNVVSAIPGARRLRRLRRHGLRADGRRRRAVRSRPRDDRGASPRRSCWRSGGRSPRALSWWSLRRGRRDVVDPGRRRRSSSPSSSGTLMLVPLMSDPAVVGRAGRQRPLTRG